MKFYAITDHAAEQAVNRLGQKPEHAKQTLLQRMQVARFQGETHDTRIFDHLKSRTRLILAKDKDVVITVYSLDSEKPEKDYGMKPKVKGYNAIIEKARVVIQRELAKARRQFTTEARKLTLTEAELGVEIAQLTLNKARAKNPLTQASIQSRINELEIGRQAVAKQLQTVADRFEQMRMESEQFIGG